MYLSNSLIELSRFILAALRRYLVVVEYPHKQECLVVHFSERSIADIHHFQYSVCGNQ